MNLDTRDTMTCTEPVRATQAAAGFTAKLAATGGTRIYRVYLQRADLFFILLAEGLSANPDTLTVHLGLIGLLIKARMKKKAKAKNAAAVQRMDQTDPEQLLSEHKRNFRLHTSEIGETSVEPRPWLVLDGQQVGYWKLLLRNGKKMKLQFETNEEMSSALPALTDFFKDSLQVKVEWDEAKKRFKKKQA